MRGWPPTPKQVRQSVEASPDNPSPFPYDGSQVGNPRNSRLDSLRYRDVAARGILRPSWLRAPANPHWRPGRPALHRAPNMNAVAPVEAHSVAPAPVAAR